MRAAILLIEDDPGTGSALQSVLTAAGYRVDLVTRGDEGLQRAQATEYQVVLSDLRLPGMDGLEVIRRLHQFQPRLPMVLMTAHGTTDTAIEATKLGACEYLVKPFEAEDLLKSVALAVRNSQRMSEVIDLGAAKRGGSALVGSSRAMQSLYKEIGRVARTSATVLIRGATGTGKELVARAIYQHSDRATNPFIAVNCAAIPPALLESELFGHERGAFTGAHHRRVGRFEQAQGGTLFLDEVGDLPMDTQAKLLRVLQDRKLQRLGGNDTIRVDVRVVAATHRNLEEAMAQREFREDLYFRLNVLTLTVPTLSERTEDIPDLVRYFAGRHAPDLKVDQPSIELEAMVEFQSQPWPGNVRELENVVRQALVLARPFGVTREHVQEALARSRGRQPGNEQTHAVYIADLLTRVERGEVQGAYWKMIEELEPELYTQAIERAGGNQAQAARWLGITRLKLREKLRILGQRPAKPGS